MFVFQMNAYQVVKIMLNHFQFFEVHIQFIMKYDLKIFTTV